VRHDDDGWCSAQLGGNILNPYLEVEFGQDVMFHAVVTEGFSSGFLSNVFLERYQIEIAGKPDDHFRYIAVPKNTTVPQPAVSKNTSLEGDVYIIVFYSCILWSRKELLALSLTHSHCCTQFMARSLGLTHTSGIITTTPAQSLKYLDVH